MSDKTTLRPFTAAAYDYEKQEWTSGDRARELRRVQLTEELNLLQGDKGQSYAKFIGYEDTTLAISSCKKQLLELNDLCTPALIAHWEANGGEL